MQVARQNLYDNFDKKIKAQKKELTCISIS